MRKRATTKEVIDKLNLIERGFKYCKNCEQTKPIGNFAEDKRHTDGLQTYCRECCNLLRRTKYSDKIKQRAKQWRHDNPLPKTIIIVTEKECSYCGDQRPILVLIKENQMDYNLNVNNVKI